MLKERAGKWRIEMKTLSSVLHIYVSSSFSHSTVGMIHPLCKRISKIVAKDRQGKARSSVSGQRGLKGGLDVPHGSQQIGIQQPLDLSVLHSLFVGSREMQENELE